MRKTEQASGGVNSVTNRHRIFALFSRLFRQGEDLKLALEYCLILAPSLLV